MSLVTDTGKTKAFVLVRDKDGNPKIDDYASCPEEIKQMLTDKEREEFSNGLNTSR